MAPDIEALLDLAQQVFIPFDFEIGVQAALHENAGAAEAERLADLIENDLVRMHVAFIVPWRAVERAEAAVLGTEICVINVAVNDIADDPVRVQLAADLI